MYTELLIGWIKKNSIQNWSSYFSSSTLKPMVATNDDAAYINTPGHTSCEKTIQAFVYATICCMILAQLTI